MVASRSVPPAESAGSQAVKRARAAPRAPTDRGTETTQLKQFPYSLLHQPTRGGVTGSLRDPQEPPPTDRWDLGKSYEIQEQRHMLASQSLVEGARSFLSKANTLITALTKHIFGD